MNCLFIGGANDGKFIEVSEDRDQIWCIKFQPQIERITDYPAETIEFERELYRAERLRGKDRTFRVFLLDGLTGDDLMERLIAHYKRI